MSSNKCPSKRHVKDRKEYPEKEMVRVEGLSFGALTVDPANK